jgi:hypothetical protein
LYVACVSAIALDALLELGGRQVIQKLGEDGLSDVHPSLLTIGATSGNSVLAPLFCRHPSQIEK